MKNDPIVLSIVIVNWNAADALPKCIGSIAANTSNIPHEIIIVDNASADGSLDIIANMYPSVVLINNTRNDGFARANNQGFMVSKGEFILLLNPDTVLHDGAIARMISALNSHKDIGIIGPRVLDDDNTVSVYSKRKFPSISQEIADIFLLTKIMRGVRSVLMKISPKFKKEYERYFNKSEDVDRLQGCCMLMKRLTYKQLNGFDESVPMYLDDIDICFRAKKVGLRIYYYAEASIGHLCGHSTKKAKNYKMYNILNLYAHMFYYKKHFGFIKVMQFKLVIGLSIPYLIALDLFTIPFFAFSACKLKERFWILRKHISYFKLLFDDVSRILNLEYIGG